MNFKKLALALSLTGAFTYMGCDESSTAPAAGGDDQPTLSSSSAGDEGGEPAASSESTGGDGTPASSASTGDEGGDPAATSSEAKAESAGSDDVPPVSSAMGSGTIPAFDSTFTFDSTAYASAMKCDQEGATKEQYGMTMTCKDGQWAVDSAAIADMMKCEAGETREQMGMVMKCKDGHWALDSAATEAANTCDEDGATKTETMDMGGAYSMEMTYICTDGKWEMQKPDFGGMFGGDSTGGFPGGNFNFGDSNFTMPGGGEIPVPGPVETAQEE